MGKQHLITAGIVLAVVAAACGLFLTPDRTSRLSEVAPYVGWGLVFLMFVAAFKSRRSTSSRD